MAVAAPQRARRDEDHARAIADEAGCCSRQGTDRLAPDRHHRRPGLSQLCLRAQPNQAAPDRRREGRYLLRTNLTESDPATLWQYYIQLVAVEEAFKNLKGDLAIRPIFHHEERRIEAHIFIAFLAYCSYITLQPRLHALAPGLGARGAIEKFAAVQIIDVHVPTTDGRELVLTRYTQPEPELQLLINQLKLQLPPQPPPKITTADQPRLPLP